MKIEIKDLGPISRFSFDLEKDFHIIFGKNSIGKSYAIYCIYIFLKKIIDSKNRNMRFNPAFGKSEDYRKLYKNYQNTINEKILNHNDVPIVIKEELDEILKSFFNDLLSDEITESFRNTFYSLSDLKNFYSHKKPEIKLTSESLSITFQLNRYNNFSVKKFQLLDTVEIRKRKRSKKLDIFVNGEMHSFFNNVISDEIPIILLSLCSNNLFNDVYKKINNIYFLPSSRSGLYLALSSFGPIIAELSKSRFQLKRKIELPTISEPISDYFIPLANINSRRVSKNLNSIISQIENNILQGSVSIDNENNRIVFQPNNTTLKLDLSVTSSMISEIAPIVTYLKHIIGSDTYRTAGHTLFDNFEDRPIRSSNKDKSIIFIEEPEAHLHPEAQIKLTEIFTELIKHGIKIVITSHSNYMFNKLVNLILSKKIDHAEVSVLHMEMTKLGSIVKEDMIATDEGINDYNFAKESEKLYEERIEILEKLNESH